MGLLWGRRSHSLLLQCLDAAQWVAGTTGLEPATSAVTVRRIDEDTAETRGLEPATSAVTVRS